MLYWIGPDQFVVHNENILRTGSHHTGIHNINYLIFEDPDEGRVHIATQYVDYTHGCTRCEGRYSCGIAKSVKAYEALTEKDINEYAYNAWMHGAH